jgi:hypothetical protein
MRRRWIVGAAMAAVALAGAAPPAGAVVDRRVQASGPSPFAPGCNGAQAGVVYPGTEVEPYIDVDPTSPLDGEDLIGVYQQDRHSSGGARGQGTSISTDGGATWRQLTAAELPRFSQCQGNPSYERATDPWVSYGPDGDAYQITLAFNDRRNLDNAVLVSETHDDGATWSAPQTLIRDTNPTVFNDKESITADPFSASHVYAVWDRLVFPNERSRGQSFEHAAAFRGPTYFTRTTNGGASWEPARPIFDPGQNDQTIGNQIVVLGTGDLVNGFAYFRNDNKTGSRSTVAVQRSAFPSRGASWSGPIAVDRLGTVEVRDPETGDPVRTGDIIPEIAADERQGNDDVYMVWQDARFNGFQRDQVAFSRSTDGGRTWSRAVRISTRNDTQAFTPQIKVDEGGNIAVTYYDFRNNNPATPALETDGWFTRSTDGGQTWREERVTPTSFDMRTAPVARGYFVGDYEGLTARGTRFFSLQSESRGSTDTFASRILAPFTGAAYTPSTAEGNVPAKAFPKNGGRPAPK